MIENTESVNRYNFEDIFYKSAQGELYKNVLDQVEKPLLEWALKKTEGNQIKAAKILGINRNTFRTKMRKLGVNPEAYK